VVTTTAKVDAHVQTRLEEELERIQRKLKLGLDLKVVWTPNPDSSLSGEIKSGKILIYDESEGKALETLRHEILDFCISEAIEPYRQVTNRLIKMMNEDAYKRKEKIVEALTRLVDWDD
jgi:hypothetical protein